MNYIALRTTSSHQISVGVDEEIHHEIKIEAHGDRENQQLMKDVSFKRFGLAKEMSNDEFIEKLTEHPEIKEVREDKLTNV